VGNVPAVEDTIIDVIDEPMPGVIRVTEYETVQTTSQTIRKRTATDPICSFARRIRRPPSPRDKDRDLASLKIEREHTPQTADLFTSMQSRPKGRPILLIFLASSRQMTTRRAEFSTLSRALLRRLIANLRALRSRHEAAP
jgi:hypothetical protein